MPAIRSRMSSSSSTMRISGAINEPFLLIRHSQVFKNFLFEWKRQTHLRALMFGCVVDGDFAAMVFNDLAHDSEAEACAFRARCNVRFCEAVAMLRRKPDAVVDDADREALVVAFQQYAHAALGVIAGRFACLNGFAGILQDV